jgi:hypothetical protein
MGKEAKIYVDLLSAFPHLAFMVTRQNIILMLLTGGMTQSYLPHLGLEPELQNIKHMFPQPLKLPPFS